MEMKDYQWVIICILSNVIGALCGFTVFEILVVYFLAMINLEMEKKK